MKIVHVGRFHFDSPDGALRALWELAKAQAACGHEVTIIRLRKPPEPNDIRIAEKHGVRLVGYPFPKLEKFLFWRDYKNNFEKLIDQLKPDIVNLQYVRIPKYFAISRILHKKKIPFVLTLHGGLNPTEMQRKGFIKTVYWNLIEKFVHQKVKALHFITSLERDHYYKIGTPKPHDAVIANTVKNSSNNLKWSYSNFNPQAPKIAFFGRYDIWHKGIDLTVELIRNLNKAGIPAEMHLHGSPEGFKSAMDRLVKENKDVSIVDHGFSDGEEMLQAMANYDLYIQYSRFELFGISLVEALNLGVPTLVSEACDLVHDLASQRAAIKISLDPKKAAETVINALKEPEELKRIGERGAELGHREFQPIFSCHSNDTILRTSYQ